MPPLRELELTFVARGHARVAGVDEVGRGPLAGPVVAAAVVLPADVRAVQWLAERADDSKKLVAKNRREVAAFIERECLFAVAEASVREIDTLNIHHAVLLAMRRAVEALHAANPCQALLVDGKFIVPELTLAQQAVVDGDARELCIACASIIAKVRRDALMAELDTLHPGYGWSSNAGYGTAAHLAGLQALGVTPHHRTSFAPVKALIAYGNGQAA
jgi:ribonuclease HII